MVRRDQTSLREPWSMQLEIEIGLLEILRAFNDLNLILNTATHYLAFFFSLTYKVRYAWYPCHFLLNKAHTRNAEKEIGLLLESVSKDYVRVFGPISRIKVHRAVWTWAVRPEDSDPLLEAFLEISDVAVRIHNDDPVREGKIILSTLGDAIWRTSCRIPSSLSPPPPYSLVDPISRADNFALTYNILPLLPPDNAFGSGCANGEALGDKRKRPFGRDPGGSGRRRRRIRKRPAAKHSPKDAGVHP